MLYRTAKNNIDKLRVKKRLTKKQFKKLKHELLLKEPRLNINDIYDLRLRDIFLSAKILDVPAVFLFDITCVNANDLKIIINYLQQELIRRSIA